MKTTLLYTAAAISSCVSARPANNFQRRTDNADFSPNGNYFPLQNGFPQPNEDQVRMIEVEALGALPGAPPPGAVISEGGIISLQVIALNELFEVAYFSELIHNVTNKVHGYDLGDEHTYVLASLEAILAQEQLHALFANALLKSQGKDIIQPCQYSFPVEDFQSAIALAATFTDLVLGTLQDVSTIFAKGGDFGAVGATAAVLGNEAEQEGFFRLLQQKRPSSKPFLTSSAAGFAFTAIQGFFVPDSCPSLSSIPLKTFKPLTVVSTDIQPMTQQLSFSYNEADAPTSDWSSLRVVFVNGIVAPIVETLEQVSVADGKVTFQATFPFDEYVMNGLTIAAVVNGTGPFADASAVSASTIFGPGLIEVGETVYPKGM